ncbi:MAG: T9SS type A sorting domain-containing protein, partial [Sphingobacteriales bacterium]
PNANVADPDPTPAAPIFRVSKDASNHNGGHMQFKAGSPTPYLYFATGDGGGGNDPGNNAQDVSSYLGKMIRINVNDASYTPEIWALGLRNPFRWSFDRQTGDIWIGDVGEATKEEINFRPAGTIGANYGWVCVEGTVTNSSAPQEADCSQAGGTVQPVFEYSNPSEGRSVIGGYVYRGNEYADLRGYYLATDFFSGNLWLIRPGGGGGWEVVGALYAVDVSQNRVFKIVTPVVTPLTLISFSGTAGNGYNDLRWTTESESSMDKYIVEYSVDGNTYEIAGEVASRNNLAKSVYTYQHAYVNRTTVYYRLKMTGLGGEVNYSPVISFGADENRDLKIYPTSVTNGKLNIVSKMPVERVIITNTMGVQVASRELNGMTGFFTVDLPVLQKGMYIVRVAGKDFQKTEKIMVQ